MNGHSTQCPISNVRCRLRWPDYAWLVALGVLLVSPVLTGAETNIISPADIVDRALAHSLQLQAADQEVNAASARKAQAHGQALPSLDVKAQAVHYEGLESAVLGPELVIPDIQDRYSASLGLTQPLFTGGRITQQRRGAAFQEDSLRAQRQRMGADLVLQALAACWNWSKAVYSTEALQSAVTRMEAHADDMRSLQKAGLATDNETLATDVLLDQTRLRLEEGRRRVDLARARIALLTGSELVESAAPQRPVIPGDVSVPAEGPALQAAFTNRPDLMAGRLEIRAAEALVRAARAESYPQVLLTGRYEQARPNVLDFPPSDEWKDDAYIGVLLAWNVWDWGIARAKTAEAAARAAQAKLRLGQTEEEITLEVREARINLQDGLDRVTTAKRVEQSAHRNLEAATAQSKSGLARHSEVLDAQAQLTDAQYQRIVAEADVLLSRAALLHAEGLLNKETN